MMVGSFDFLIFHSVLTSLRLGGPKPAMEKPEPVSDESRIDSLCVLRGFSSFEAAALLTFRTGQGKSVRMHRQKMRKNYLSSYLNNCDIYHLFY